MNHAEQALFDLVSTPSVSGSERAAAEVFVRHAAALGLEYEIDEVGNALAHRGASDAPVHIVLLGHIDTVPGDIPVRIEEGVLHGRGSVDAKGPLAAMLVAGARADVPKGVRVTVAGAVGEETAGSPGARHLAARYAPDACIIGEPSDWNGVTLGYKGRLLVRAACARDCGHSAGPEASACDELHARWTSVVRLVEELNAERSRLFDLVQASVLDQGSQNDGMRQTAMMTAGFRLPLHVAPEDLVLTLRERAGDGVALEFDGMERAAASDRNDPVVRALSSAIRAVGGRARPKLKTGTADFNVVAPVWRCPIAAYGPGDSSLDHTPTERLSLAEYSKSIAVLERAIATVAAELLIAHTPGAPAAMR